MSSDFLIKTILEHSPVAVLVVDEDGKMIFINQEASTLFGYSKAELLNKEVEVLLPNHLRDGHVQQRSDFINHQHEPRRMGVGRDLFGMHKHGNLIPVEIGLNPIEVDQKLFVIATVINITERKRKQDQQLDQLILNLEKSNRELEEYANMIAHDLQNPLAVVFSYIEALQDMEGEKYQEQLVKIKAAVKRMSLLTNNLLAISHLGTKILSFQEVNLNNLINDVLADNSIQMAKVGAKIDITELGSVEADPTLLRELFHNLLTNAAKFHKVDQPPLISISSRDGGDVVIIEVEDNGVGIQDTLQIFTLFHRENKESVSGHGIGLAVCKKIVDLHSGTIAVDSLLAQGTKFTVTLPKTQPEKKV